MSSHDSIPLVDNCLICTLRKDNFFCALPQRALAAFEKIKSSASYQRNEVLFVEGQSPGGIYMLCRGRAKLSVNSADGKTLILKLAEPGEVLGLHACVSGISYELTAETIQPSQVNFVKRDDFLRFLEEHGEACLQAAHHLSDNCHSAYDLLRSLGHSHSVGEKLARFLLALAQDGETTPDGIHTRMGLTHEEIAQVIGTSRETVTRLLTGFRKKKLATVKGAALVIHNKAGLEELVGS